MIASKQIAFGKAAGKVLSAKDYVQDGLVAMWDGIENAGWGVHDPNATAWESVVGGATLNLPPNAVFTDDGLKIDRTKTYRQTTVSTAPFFADYAKAVDNLTLTFEVAYRLDDYGTSASTSLNDTVRNTFSVARYYGFLCPINETGVYINSNQAGNGNYWILYSIDNTGCHTLTATYIPSGKRAIVKLYIDGVFVAKQERPGSGIADDAVSFSNLKGGKFLIGPTAATNGASVDYLRRFNIYTRDLTAEEIAYNYEIDKERFGV